MSAPAPGVWEFDAIGTRWHIVTAAPLAEAARADIAQLIDGFDREWSRFRADSVVSALADGGDAPPPQCCVLSGADALARSTPGRAWYRSTPA